jgi:hypothetical protein
MAENLVLLGRSVQSPIDNKTRHDVVLPGKAATDFVLTARCQILNIGARISMSASDLPGDSGGIYNWRTDSKKVRLINQVGSLVAIEAFGEPGSARDSEVIFVTRIASDGSKKEKSVPITVAKVIFEAAVQQKYGYDDFDTPLIKSDDHICVKSDGETMLAVKIEGGAIGTDFEFSFDDPGACTMDPAPATAKFNLRIQAKTFQKKDTILRSKVRCPSYAEFASIAVHVYSEQLVKIVVAKIFDSQSVATALKFPTADYAKHQDLANAKLREGVVRFELKNLDKKNEGLDVAVDQAKTGALTFDINSAGGSEFKAIKEAVHVPLEAYGVVIVRNMRSFYYLDLPARKGDTSISVRGANVFISRMPMGTGATLETVDIIRNQGNIGYLASPLSFDHAAGEPLEFPAVAWSSNPIIIAEGNETLDVVKWTILHEIGHSALKLLDVVDLSNFMNHDVGNVDHRLRYCPRQSEYDPGVTENQWETIPRPLPE